MDLHRLAALQRRWRRSPPLQHMVQAYLGIEVPEEPPARPRTPDEEAEAVQQFIRNFTAAGGRIH